MTGTRRLTRNLLAVALVAVGFLGCGSRGASEGEWRTRSENPTPEATAVLGKAAAVTVTYYYLPG
ncbi:MAG TPA: hypothetical protein VFP58_12800 [Candidatus Eisenbacteria bacterium]|nr:hypothetical protein [Candidatus Eisenbacteria bacterium]